MDSNIIAAIVGAAIAIVGGVVGAFVQHFLYLRAEKKKREWEREERESERRKSKLLVGTEEVLAQNMAQLESEGKGTIHIALGNNTALGGEVEEVDVHRQEV